MSYSSSQLCIYMQAVENAIIAAHEVKTKHSGTHEASSAFAHALGLLNATLHYIYGGRTYITNALSNNTGVNEDYTNEDLCNFRTCTVIMTNRRAEVNNASCFEYMLRLSRNSATSTVDYNTNVRIMVHDFACVHPDYNNWRSSAGAVSPSSGNEYQLRELTILLRSYSGANTDEVQFLREVIRCNSA